MITKFSVGFAILTATFSGVAWGQAQADAMTIAQAHDRCMTTQAVRLTRTDASDEAIFQTATQTCKELETGLLAALRAERPREEAEAIIATMSDQAQANFQTMLDRIRADRAARAAQ